MQALFLGCRTTFPDRLPVKVRIRAIASIRQSWLGQNCGCCDAGVCRERDPKSALVALSNAEASFSFPVASGWATCRQAYLAVDTSAGASDLVLRHNNLLNFE